MLFVCCLKLQAQTVIVLDENSKAPIAGVELFNKNKTKITQTNRNGKVNIDQFLLNEIIKFQNFTYKSQEITKAQLAKTNYILLMEEDLESLDQVVISASKFKQSKRDIPQTIISLSSKDILLTNPQTSADALERTGNVYIQKSQLGGGSPMIRGFSTNRLLISVDGVRMNNAIFRGGNLQNVISIDPFAIANTEVTLGAGSVVYGSDAIGGVMGFYTKTPKLSYKDTLYLKGNAITRYSSANNEKTVHADINLGYKKWGFLTSISFSDFSDLRMGSHGPSEYLRPNYVKRIDDVDTLVENNNPKLQKSTGYNQINVMQKVRYELTDNLKFDFGLHYSTTSKYARYDRLIRPSNEGLRSAEWNYGPQKWLLANLAVTKLSSSSPFYDKIHASVAYQNFKESRIDRNFQSIIRRTRSEEADAISFNVDLEKQFSDKSSFFYGIEYLYNLVSSRGVETNITSNQNTNSISRYPDGATWQSIAAYSSYKYKPNKKVVFQSGLRYNHVIARANFTDNNVFLNLPFETSRVNVGALTGTAGIRWLPIKTLEWNLNASTAFRAPNIDDIGKVFDSEPGAVVVPNDNLKPEYAYGAEFGFKLKIENKFILNVATYYTFLDNALIRRNFSLNGQDQIIYDGELSDVQAIQNGSKENIYGLEIGVEYNFHEKLKLKTQYNLIGGTEEDNGVKVPVRHIAPNFGRTHLIWKADKLYLDLFAVYNDKLSFADLAPSELSKEYLYASDKNGNPYSPSWYTLNFRAQYKFNKKLSTSIGIENITDQRYRTYSSGISAAGRNLIVSLNYNF